MAETGLDLLEKYLKHGKNTTGYQRERWTGDYPLTVLNEALRLIHLKYGYTKPADLVSKYPKIPELAYIDKMLLQIGNSEIGFKEIRDEDFPYNYGVKRPTTSSSGGTASSDSSSGTGSGSTSSTGNGSGNGKGSTGSGASSAKAGASKSTSGGKSHSSKDPKSVAAALKKIKPKSGRAKVVTLRNELIDLNLDKNPIAFCFLLRSIFEISSKFYCKDHHISLKTQPKDPKKKPQDKSLAELLKDIKKHIVSNSPDKKIMENLLHGATTELTRSDGILSVRSFNQLVHGESFQITTTDICVLFGNIFPLLEEMNK